MLTGIILAGGGQGSGSGGAPPVWMLQAGGMSLIERQIGTMRQVCDEVTVVTNQPRPLLQKLGAAVRIVTDFYPQAGALGGLHAGLALARKDTAWVVGCDMPLLTKQSALLMLEHKGPRDDAVIPLIGGAFFPLYGLYSTELAQLAQETLEAGETGMPAFLKRIRWKEIPEDAFKRAGCDLRFITVVRSQDDLGKEDFLGLCDNFHNAADTDRVSLTQNMEEGMRNGP